MMNNCAYLGQNTDKNAVAEQAEADILNSSGVPIGEKLPPLGDKADVNTILLDAALYAEGAKRYEEALAIGSNYTVSRMITSRLYMVLGGFYESPEITIGRLICYSKRFVNILIPCPFGKNWAKD